MKLTEIKYKNTITKVIFKKIDDYAFKNCQILKSIGCISGDYHELYECPSGNSTNVVGKYNFEDLNFLKLKKKFIEFQI